jgi:hypothetical protein
VSFPFHRRATATPPTIEQQLRAAALAPENVTGLDAFLAQAAPHRTDDQRRAFFAELVDATAAARIPGGGNDGAHRRTRAERRINTLLGELLDGSHAIRRVA